MILTLSARCLRSMLLPSGKGKKPTLDLLDLPRFTRENLGLAGMNLSTDLLAGADRARVEAIRERADRAGCACLLLIEHEPQNFGSPQEASSQAAIARTIRVAEAAHVLGCSSIAVRVKANDDDAALLRVAAGLKKVVERAEKLDINLLLAPEAGLTGTPERLTELLKKIGGFRVGTFPDFEAAAQTSDPAGYLHRLTPYATAVCASTIKLLADAPPPGAGGKGGSKSVESKALEAALADIAAMASAGSPKGRKGAAMPEGLDDEEDVDIEALEAAGGAKKKASKKAGKKQAAPEEASAVEPKPTKGGKKVVGKKGKAEVVPPPPPIDDDDDADLDEAEMDELEAMIEAAMEDPDLPPRLVALQHEPYDLRPLVMAVNAVGYDGSLCLDYRGSGDVVMGLQQTRDTLLALIAEARAK